MVVLEKLKRGFYNWHIPLKMIYLFKLQLLFVLNYILFFVYLFITILYYSYTSIMNFEELITFMMYNFNEFFSV